MYFDPWEEIRRLHSYIDRMFSDLMRSPRVSVSVREPLVDLLDEGDRFRLVVELPGMSKEDIDVRVTEDSVTIRAEKKGSREEKGKNYFIRERTYATYYRTIPLPEPVIPEETKARYNNGVLEIVLKKARPGKSEEGYKVNVE